MRSAIVALGLSLSLLPGRLWACGGCFSPPPPPGQTAQQLVVQNAERVFFSVQGKDVLAWIEVRYSGEAKNFAWVLPLPQVPEVGVGTQYFLDRLDNQLAPVFSTSLSATDENCRSPYDGCEASTVPVSSADAGSAFGDAGAGAGGGNGGGGGSVEVLAQGQTGPYDYVVVKGKESGPLLAWLNKNGYQIPDKSLPIVGSHLAKGDVFLALKLQNGKGIETIRPITLKMVDAHPCVPLRLTSIAATDDMTVVVTVAGAGRAVPKNSLHVVVNPLRLNWFAGAANYPQVLAAAIDEAGTHAFSTEAAGNPTTLIDPQFVPQSMDLQAFQGATQVAALAKALAAAQLPLMPELVQALAKASPALLQAFPNTPTEVLWQQLPACQTAWSLDAGQTCLLGGTPCGGGGMGGPSPVCGGKALSGTEAAALPVDSTTLSAALKEVAEPLLAARAQLLAAPTVTRLVLRISPDEMDRDPFFVFNPGLPDVNHVHKATFRRVCSNGWYPATQTRLTLDEFPGLSWIFDGSAPNDGGQLGNNALDPRFSKAPLAWKVELLQETGGAQGVAPGQVPVVDAALANAKAGQPSLPDGMSLQPVSWWTPPAGNPPVSKAGPWPMPPGCKPKPGWQDGKPAPSGAVVGSDAGASTGTDVGGSAGASDASSGDAVEDAGSTPKPGPISTVSPDSSSGCKAARAPASWSRALGFALMALVWRRRSSAN
jgi:hypothetical protein